MSPPSESTSSRAASASILVACARGGFVEPLDGLAFFDAGEFDDGEMLAEGLADALVALLVGHLHAAQVGRDADVVGDEDEQRVGIGVAEVVGDGGELGVVLAASVERLDAAHEEDLEAGHQRRRAGAVENFDDRRGLQIELVEAELAHPLRDEVLEDGVAAGAAEEGLIADEDVAGLELARADLLHEALDRGKGFQARRPPEYR